MKSIINLYKPIAMTPFQAVQKFKQNNPAYKNTKISYPGRLDPMAEGLLLLLVGDENKKMINYMKLDKEYQAKILFGFSSDSFDILGLPEKKVTDIDIKILKKTIKNLKGTYNQKIPVFSSHRIKRKPLFYHARTNNLKNIKIPEKTVIIKNIIINSIYTITANRLLKEIKNKINKLTGDFRQKQILEKWGNLLKNKNEKFIVADITISCSSGTYIRAIANDLGKSFGSGLLLNLIRTKIGKFSIKNSVRLKH
jgi:tRNA pseudouridine55 synthase